MSKDIFDFWALVRPDDKIHPADTEVLTRVEHSFDLNCLPSPFYGPLRTAPVVLLYLSPGLSEPDFFIAQSAEGQKRYFEMRTGYEPLPSKEDHLMGWRWWNSRVKLFGAEENLRQKIAILNIGAYHSKTFEHYELLASLPSCRVSIDWAQDVLFPQAVAGERMVICMRAAPFWGLTNGRQYGKSLFAPEVTRSGHMVKNSLREQIVTEVQKKLLPI